jgi:hypothetical protein
MSEPDHRFKITEIGVHSDGNTSLTMHERVEHHMKAVFAGLLVAGLVLATPISAKFIGTMYYMPSAMLGMCKSDIARGEAGFCTGYVIATWEQMAGAGEICRPPGIEYEDMVRAVVLHIDPHRPRRARDVRGERTSRRPVALGAHWRLALKADSSRKGWRSLKDRCARPTPVYPLETLFESWRGLTGLARQCHSNELIRNWSRREWTNLRRIKLEGS